MPTSAQGGGCRRRSGTGHKVEVVIGTRTGGGGGAAAQAGTGIVRGGGTSPGAVAAIRGGCVMMGRRPEGVDADAAGVGDPSGPVRERGEARMQGVRWGPSERATPWSCAPARQSCASDRHRNPPLTGPLECRTAGMLVREWGIPRTVGKYGKWPTSQGRSGLQPSNSRDCSLGCWTSDGLSPAGEQHGSETDVMI